MIVSTHGILANSGISYSYLLDTYTNANIAFSMFKLRSAYSGSCLTVRRSSDNTEQDIGFVNNYLDTATLLSFVGSGDGFVVKWYNQSGNVNNLGQTIASNQPQIVSSGSLITRNSVAYIRASSTQYLQFATQINNTTHFSWWMTYEKNNTSNNAILAYNNTNVLWGDNGTTQNISSTDTITISPALSSNTLYLMNNIYLFNLQPPTPNISFTFYKNGTSIGSGTATKANGANVAAVQFVPHNAFRTATITFNEFILWKTNQTSNRTAIENNIKTRNLIY